MSTATYQESRRNLALNPRGAGDPAGAVVVRSNAAPNPRVATRTGWAATVPDAGTTVVGAELNGLVIPGLDVTTGLRYTFLTLAGAGVACAVQLGTVAGYRIDVTPGQTITASIHGRVSRSGQQMGCRVAWLDVTGAQVGSVGIGPLRAVAAEVWARHSYTGVVPAGASHVRVDYYCGAGAPWVPGDWREATAVLVETSSFPNAYFDGGTPASGTTSYRWTGDPTASTSEALLTPALGWAAAAGGTAWVATDDGPVPGLGYVEITGGAVLRADPTVGHRVGQTRTVSVWVNGDAKLSAGAAETAVIGDGTWKRLAVTYTPTAPGPVKLQLTGAGPFRAGGLLVELTGTAGTYFDGSTADTAAAAHRWTGFADASASALSVPVVVVVTPPGGQFTPRSSLIWGLGDFDAPQMQFGGVDSFGVEWVMEGVEGWTTTDADLAVQDSAADGGWFGPGRRPSKVLTMRGGFRASCKADADDAEQRFRDAAAVLHRDQVLWAGGPVPKQMTIRQSGPVIVDQVAGNPRIRRFSAVVTAADPYRYAAGAAGLQEVDLRLLARPSSGLRAPWRFPLRLGGGLRAWQRFINPGDQPVWPELLIDGPVLNPRITHRGLGQYFGVTGALAGPVGARPGDVATSSFEYSTLLVNGVAARNRRQPGSTYWQLPKGVNELRFTADSFPSSTTRALLRYRPAWL